MKRWGISAMLLAVVAAAAPRVSRSVLHAMEINFDKRIQTLSPDVPFELLGNTRGVYLDGYGAVFTSELNLSQSTNLSPFQPTIPKEYVSKLRLRKLERLPVLKKCMQEQMVAMASALDMVPANERIVLGVTLLYHKWEDTSALPSQIVMQGERQKLLGGANHASLDSIIRVQEL